MRAEPAAGGAQRPMPKVASASALRSWSVAQPLSLPDKLIRPSVGGGPSVLPRLSGTTVTSAASVASSAGLDGVPSPIPIPNPALTEAAPSPSRGARAPPGRSERTAGVDHWVDQSAAAAAPAALAAAAAANAGIPPLYPGAPSASARCGSSASGGSRRASLEGHAGGTSP